MSKIPETIWVARNIITQSTMWWEEEVSGGQEYIRADIAAAQVAAAYELAAGTADVKSRRGRPVSGPHHAGLRDGRKQASKLIRALATDTQTDALERVRKEAEQAGYERGVREAMDAALGDGEGEWFNHIQAIADLLDKPTPDPDEPTKAAQELALRKAVSS